MNKIYLIILFFAGILVGCEPDAEDFGPNIPNLNDNIGAITTLTVNPDANFFNALNDLNSAFVEFTIDVDGFGVTEISSVDIEVTYTAVGRLPNPDPAGDPLPQVFDAVIVQNLSSFPGTVKLTAPDLAAAFNTEVDSFRVGDNFRAVFPINTADGRRLTIAVSSDLCQQPAQPSFGGCNFDWVISCPVDANFAIGSYMIETVSGSSDPFYGGERFDAADGIVELTASGPTSRSFQIDYLTNFSRSLTFNLVCGTTVVPEQGASLGCNVGILWAPGALPEGFSSDFDLDSDVVFFISITDDSTNDCGILDNSVVLKLTKV